MFHRAVFICLVVMFISVYLLNLYWYKFLIKGLMNMAKGKEVSEDPNGEQGSTEDEFKRVDDETA